MIKNKKQIMQIQDVQNRIFSIRGTQVMIDEDLARMYAVETKVLNQAVKRNINRFPDKFRFQLTNDEYLFVKSSDDTENLKSQTVTSSLEHGGRRKLPFVFSEQGVAMLSAVLRSDTAVSVSILIMDAFVCMRNFLSENARVFNRLDDLERKQISYQIKTDKKVEYIFKALESKSVKAKQGIFYDGQIFDAYVFVADIIKSAEKSIVLIDNYVDESVLQLFSKRKNKVSVTIFTSKITNVLKQDVEKHNLQYPSVILKTFRKSHDRFLIIDETTIYHIGASLKDLGKKWFAFSKMDTSAVEMLHKLNG
ncbi:MAG: ORF6N domain-containing protein [Kiritimatiellae bacterium]|nr:ORF6N domain-containing protein [Kiritimatiellia bacterium]